MLAGGVSVDFCIAENGLKYGVIPYLTHNFIACDS
jgi:hypothetical protein